MSIVDSKAHADLPLWAGVPAESLLSLLSISPDALLVVDQSGNLTLLNERAEELFGYAHTELEGQPLEVLLPERFRSGHSGHLMRYFSAPTTRSLGSGLQLFGMRKDGTEFLVDISLTPIVLDETHCAIGAVRDMTAAQHSMDKQRAAYHEIEQHLSMLNMILSAATEAVSLFDTQGRYRFVSESAARRHGIAQDSFVGKTPQELGMAVEFLEPFFSQFKKVLSSGQTVVDEILFPINSEMRWFEYVARPVLDQDGTIEFVVISSVDITERQEAATTLRRMATIVESSNEAIFSKTLDGVVTSWNRGAEKLYGYRAEEIIGQSISRLFLPKEQQELWDILANVKTGKIVKDFESIRVRKDGTFVEVSITISPITDRKGVIVGASTIAHDITEHKRLMRELMDVNTALIEAKKVRDQFVGTMSHELRTPLASIIGFSEMLLKGEPEAELNLEQCEEVECILRNGYHLLDLVNDVLDLEKIEAQHMEIAFTLVDVKHLLTTVVEEIQSIAAAHQLVLSVEVEEGIGYIETDRLRLQQVLLNLVTNALKFTKQGAITVSASFVAHSGEQAKSVAIAVKDNGIGIPLDKQGQIFEAFYQVDGSYTRQFGGTGLGLSIVNQFTKLLGGKVEVVSTPGEGSTFTVTLPIKAAQLVVAEDLPRLHPARKKAIFTVPPNADSDIPIPAHERWLNFLKQAESKGQSNVVLAVDDDPDAIAIIKRALQKTPLKVVGVQDSTEVQGLVESLHPCAITLDVMMPRINGWQLLHKLKDNPASAAIPVVMISVLDEQTTGYVLGADAYLLKPLKIDELINTLQHILPETQTAAKGWDESKEDART